MSPPEFHLRIVAPLTRHVAEQHGLEAVARVARAAGLDPTAVQEASAWVSWAELEALLAGYRSLYPSDESFTDACAHDAQAAHGPLRYLVGAFSPESAYHLAPRHMRLISRVSEFETTSAGPGSTCIVYRSRRAESRLMCLSRIAQIRAVPRLWGLPDAHVQERACLARGDDRCEYRADLYAAKRWSPAALGALLGAATGLLLAPLELGSPLLGLLTATVGLLAGHGLELRRAVRVNERVARRINEAYLSMARQEAEARREILAITHREREWMERLEAAAADRERQIRDIVQRLEALQRSRASSIQGVSHDLKAPLLALRLSVGELMDRSARLGPDDLALAQDIAEAVTRTERLVAELMRSAAADLPQAAPRVSELAVPEITDRLRSRLRALVQGRDIRAVVLPAREAPATVKVDGLLFDRVLDNLLTNACKYTERGSIVVEVGGTPGNLTIKISDTGRGIAETDIERAFRPRGSRPETRAPASDGLGLSVVADLLSAAGGQLEVMSKPNVGTTVWVSFPVNGPPLAEPDDTPGARPHAPVIRIRKAASA